MHWTQTPNGRKRMSRIAKNRYARVRANLGAAPLQAERNEKADRLSGVTPEMIGQQKKESAELLSLQIGTNSIDEAITFCETQIKNWTCNLKLIKRIKWCMKDDQECNKNA